MVLAGENGVIMSCSPFAMTQLKPTVNPAHLNLQAPAVPSSQSLQHRHIQLHIL